MISQHKLIMSESTASEITNQTRTLPAYGQQDSHPRLLIFCLTRRRSEFKPHTDPKMDPEGTSDPNGMAAPDAIHPIFAQSIEFLEALIEKDKSGEGTMSRPTKLAIGNSIKRFKDSEFTAVPTERSNWLATKETTNIQRDMVQRVEDDKNYIEARFRTRQTRHLHRSRSMYRDLWQQIRIHSGSSVTCLGRRSRVDWKQSGTNQALGDI